MCYEIKTYERVSALELFMAQTLPASCQVRTLFLLYWGKNIVALITTECLQGWNMLVCSADENLQIRKSCVDMQMHSPMFWPGLCLVVHIQVSVLKTCYSIDRPEAVKRKQTHKRTRFMDMHTLPPWNVTFLIFPHTPWWHGRHKIREYHTEIPR